MTIRTTFASLAAIAAVCVMPAAAQSIGAESVVDEDATADEVGETRGRRLAIAPYIEAQQVVLFSLSPGDEVLTYSVLAAGVDVSAASRRIQGGASIRYERRIYWDDTYSDSDTLSGLVRANVAVVPRNLQFEVGALAARTRTDGTGFAGLADREDRVSQVYSGYAGPSFRTVVDNVSVDASYRFGYSRVEQPDVFVVPGAAEPVDLFDESTTHQANARVATAPGDPLPVGIGVGGAYYREDIDNLDQRIEDIRLRADATLPVSPTLAVVAGVGYEDVEVSARDVLLDANGDPIVGADGRFVVDPASPRTIAYDVEGVIYDAGILWRPSRRTSLQATVGRKYGSWTVSGAFNWQPTARTSINVSVYDRLTGFGGSLVNSLASLPTDFEVIRNPVTGELSGCVTGTEGGTCLNGGLGALRGGAFRARGINGSYAVDFGRMQAGVGLGYERRELVNGTGVLAAASGLVDESYFTTAYLNGQIDRNSSFATNAYLSIFDSNQDGAGVNGALGAQAAYFRDLIENLTASAAVGIDGLDLYNQEDIWTASARVGLRYTF